MASALSRMYKFYLEIENVVVNNLIQRYFPGQLVPVFNTLPRYDNPKEKISLRELLQESFLWAVPKKRRSVEKVRQRRFGNELNWKPLVPNKRILVCNACGGYHEYDTICGTCYTKVMEETRLMQDEISKELGIKPVEEEVIVLYEGEKEKQPDMWKEKRIVEMKKPRPIFFSKNLLQGSTQKNAESSELMDVVQPIIEYK